MIRASSVLCCGLLASEADAAETTRSISFNSFFPISAVVDADQNIPESSDRASQVFGIELEIALDVEEVCYAAFRGKTMLMDKDMA